MEKLKEIQLNKSEEEKYLLHKYKTALDIHLTVVPQSDGKYMVHVSYFTTVRLDNPKYCIKLLYNTNFKCWTCKFCFKFFCFIYFTYKNKWMIKFQIPS